ncbi:MAG: sigma-70 family RNA polymerase sigma factor, partial [Cyclobacteriaceae bacterium]
RIQAVGSEREDLIWERFKAGDQKALKYIFQNYSNFLFNYGSQFTTDRNLIKDCLQDLFLDLIRQKKNLNSTTSIKFYLMRSFRNKLVANIQKNQTREKAEQAKTAENKSFMVTISSEVKMINGQLDAEKQRLIERKLNELPPLQREAILLYFYEGLKYSEVAELLGVRVKSARSLIYRSLESLKDLLSPYKGVILLLTFLIGIYNFLSS